MIPLVHLAIALAPLGFYLLWIGLRGLRRRPTVLSGSQNTAEVAVALWGLLMVGPLPMLIPTASLRYQHYVWVLVLTIYIMVIVLIMLLSRPHIIVSNVTIETLRPLVNDTLKRMNEQFVWAGDSIVAPHAGLQFRLESQPLWRSVVILANCEEQNLTAWNRLRKELSISMRNIPAGRHPWCLGWLAAGAACIGFAAYQVTTSNEEFAQVFWKLLLI
jgi:uncharacterized membrane protein